MGYSSRFVKGIRHAKKICLVVLVVMYQTLSQPTVTRRLLLSSTGRVGMTNVIDLRRRQWSTAGFLDIALVRTTVTKHSTDQ